MAFGCDVVFQELLAKRQNAFGIQWKNEVAEAVRDCPDNAGILAIDAERKIWNGDLEGAQEIIRRIRRTDPFNIEGRAVEGVLCSYEGDYEKARQILLEVLTQDPTSFTGLLHLPGTLSQMDLSDEAEYYRTVADETYPNSSLMMASRCHFFFSKGDNDRLDEILDRFQDDPSGRFQLVRARMAVKTHDWIRSEELAREAVAMNPDSYGAWQHLSLLLTKKGEFTEAKAAAGYALELNKRATVALKQLAEIAQREGREEESEEYERRAREAVPFLAEQNKISEITLLLKGHQFDAAISELRKYLKSKSPACRQMAMGKILRTLIMNPSNKNGLQVIEEVEAMGNRSPLFFSTKAYVLMTNKKNDRAFATIAEGLEKYPNDFDIQMGRIRCLKLSKATSELREAAEQLLEKGLTAPHQHISVVSNMEGSSMNDLRQRYYDDLVKKFPNFRQAGMIEAMIENGKGNYGKGIQIFHDMAARGDIHRDPYPPKVMLRILLLRCKDIIVLRTRKMIKKLKKTKE